MQVIDFDDGRMVLMITVLLLSLLLSLLQVIDFDDGRMVLMPSGCWVKAPRVLVQGLGYRV